MAVTITHTAINAVGALATSAGVVITEVDAYGINVPASSHGPYTTTADASTAAWSQAVDGGFKYRVEETTLLGTIKIRYVDVPGAGGPYDLDAILFALTAPISYLGATPWTDYTPSIGSSGSGTAIGNGTLTGYWSADGLLAHVSFVMIWGSTSTAGTGDWYITLPSDYFPSGGVQGDGVGVGVIADASTGVKYRTLIYTDLLVGLLVLRFLAGDVVAQVGAGVPITWATGDLFFGRIDVRRFIV